jgi:adenosylcobinamide-GDP ribazoletransferase
MLRPFFIALQFLTRLPVRLSSTPDETSVAYSLSYYPLVGLIIGALLASVAWLLNGAPELISAALLLIIWVLITGGLHLDGLADSMDAWAGGLGDREKTLAIMKDPSCGPAGVVGIVLLLLLKFVALHAMIESENLIVILLAPLLGRTVLLLLFITTPYVRSNGLGSAISSCLPRRLILFVFIVTLVGVFVFAGVNSLWLMLVMVLIFVGLRVLMMRRIGGMTGDVAGGVVEVVEVGVLVVGVFVY